MKKLATMLAVFSIAGLSAFGETGETANEGKIEFNPPTIMRGTRCIADNNSSDINTDRLAHKYLQYSSEDESVVWEDITPRFFNFHKTLPGKEELLSSKVTHNYGGFTGEPQNDWVLNLEKEDGYKLSDGVIFFAGEILDKGDNNPTLRNNFISGISLLDLGDEVGNVLAYNGNFCKFMPNVLSGGYYTDYTLGPNSTWIAPPPAGSNQVVLMFLPVDNDAYIKYVGESDSQKFTIRARVEFNTYSNNPQRDMSALGDVTGIFDNYGDIIRQYEPGVDKNKNYNVNLLDFSYYDHADSPNRMTWDATKWMTYEVNLIVDKGIFNDNYPFERGVPCVRIQFPSQNINNMMYLIRNVQMFITEGELDNSSGCYISTVKQTVNTYKLRPSKIEVKKQKLYVGEETTLSANVGPTWATRDVRWVLVDNQGQQYQSLTDGVPSEISDHVKYFDSTTGKITAKKNGTIKVQAISTAEGTDKNGEQVKKVMSAVTELPIFDVIYGIELRHEHHRVSDSKCVDGYIELSGSEKTRVEYVLKPAVGVETPRFDPDTELMFTVNGKEGVSATNYITIEEGTAIHGKKYTTDKYEGYGAFDLTVDNNSPMDDAILTVKVNDGRESKDQYRDAFIGRDGTALLRHYGRPTAFTMNREVVKPNGGYHNLYESDLMRICIQWKPDMDYTYIIRPLVKSASDADNDQSAKQIYMWELNYVKGEDDPASANARGMKNAILEVTENTDGTFTLKPLHSGTTSITFSSLHAGEHKSSLASLNETLPAGMLNLPQSNIETPTDEPNDFHYETIYEPYGPVWSSAFANIPEFDSQNPQNVSKNLIIEINGSGTSGIESAVSDSEDENNILYNLNGHRVDRRTAARGVYVSKNSNGEYSKVIIH